MISFKTNRYNDEYIMFEVRGLFGLGQSQKLAGKILDEANKMFWGIYEFEKENNCGYVKEVAIRKDSIMGQYFLNSNDEDITNEDTYVYEEDIKSALLIAIYDNNPIAERIMPIFRNQIYGYKKELMKLYDEETLDYILTHENFYEWIDKKEKESKEYIVFENGEYCKKKLSTGKVL